MKLQFLLILVPLLLCGCLSYQDLHDMKSVENKPDAKENLLELVEVLEEPCDDPNFYAHVMETAAFLRKGLILEDSLSERYKNAFYRIITAFDLSESDEWEVRDISLERDYLQALALQLVFDRKGSYDSTIIIKKYFQERSYFSKEQWLIYIKAVERNKAEIKKDIKFSNDYLNSFFFTKHHFSNQEKKFFASQMDYFLNSNSAFLFGRLLKVFNPNKDCMNSLLEFTYKNNLNFDHTYTVEDLLRDLATYQLTDKYQLSLRDSLYLKFLNFKKMNTLVSKHFNQDILSLNEQLLAFTINRKFQWSKIAFQKNINLLIEKSRANSSLALKTKKVLMRLAPNLYAFSLIERSQDSKSFEDVISLYSIVNEHKKFFKSTGHSYNVRGRSFLNPYFLITKKSDEDLWFKNYIYGMAKSYANSFLASKQTPSKLRPLTFSLQTYKLVGMDVFSGAFTQEKLIHTVLGQQQKWIDESLIPYLINLNEKDALRSYLNYLSQGSPAPYQIMIFTELYEKTNKENKALLSKGFSGLLQKRVQSKNDEVSLHAMKLIYRLNFLGKEFENIVKIRWPQLKALEGVK